MSDLNGKVAIVSGGGRGIGRAHTLALAKAGAAVVVNDVGQESFSGAGEASLAPAEEVVGAILAGGGRAIANGADISDWDAAGTVIDAAVEAFGRLDILVNNAGITRFGPIDEISADDWHRTIAVNLTGTAALTHWAAKHWRAAGPETGRRIVNTSSGVGLTPVSGNPMYVAAKAGVAGLTISSAIELADLGVRVNGIAPVARSRISRHVAGPLMDPVEGFDRMSPDHAAALMTYLASPECRFTGRILGAIGTDLTLYEGWTVSHLASNGEASWTAEGLAAAVAEWPVQQDGQAQGVMGLMPNPTPNQPTLEALAAVDAA